MSSFKPLLLSLALIVALLVPSAADAVTAVSTKGIFTITSSKATRETWADLEKCTPLKEVKAADDPTFLDIPDNATGLHLVKFLFFQSIALGGNPFTSTPSTITYYGCPAEVFAKIQTESEISTLSTIPRLLVSIIAWFIRIINAVLAWVLSWAGYLLILMIGQGKFITSDIVKQAWPFVQGIANLGFIFALLYIALATTLRMESVSVSVQKLIPKLLIAALLVNFSLVIGGLLIDASRLLMAAEIKLMGNGSLDYNNFTAELTKKSNQTAATLASMSNIGGNDGSALVLKMIQSSLFLGLLTLAIALIAINLFIRYVVLLILLILSPLAYLALALPKTSPYASQWWSMFIKWLLYGPIVLFFLIIVTRVQNVDVALTPSDSENKLFIAFFNQFIHFAIIIALFFIGNSVAKKVAGAGSDAVMSFAKKNPRAALVAGASLASGGVLGGLAATMLSSRSARDFYGDTRSNIAKRARSTELFGKDTTLSKAAKFIVGPERGKDGKLKDGEESWGSQLADRLPVSTSTDGRAAIQAVASAGVPQITLWNPTVPGDQARYQQEEATAQASITALQNSPALSPTKLMKKTTANALSKDQINTIMKHGSDAQREALASHKEVVKKMGDDVKGHITTNLLAAGTDVKKKVDSRMRDLANKD